MKLIIAGATGFVGKELIRQALSHPDVTSIVALGRRPTSVPENLGQDADAAKLKSVVCEDFEDYSESVKSELAGARACIWLIAITPAKYSSMPWQEVRKICVDYTVAGFKQLMRLPRETTDPLRFIYVSGAHAQRDESKKPWFLADYLWMRGEAESRVMELAAGSEGAAEACVAKPGPIFSPGITGLLARTIRVVGLPLLDVEETAAALLDQAVRGFEKDTLLNDDLARIGQKVLSESR